MWSFESKQLIHRQQLLDVIFGNKIISGITLLGGEPLHQAKNIWWLLEQIRLHSHLTIFLFTGYEMNELEKFGFQARIESLCDIVAIGRYDNNQRNIRQQWIGSDNQSVFYPKNSREYNKPIPCNQAELIISHDGKVTILGFPDDGLISALNL